MSTTSTDPDAVGTTTGKDELDKWNWGAFLWGSSGLSGTSSGSRR